MQKSVLATIAVGTATLVANVAAVGKPVGGPAIMNVTVWEGGNFKCTSINSKIPTDGSAGAPTSFSTQEDGCAIINPSLDATSVISATLTQAPKSGTLGCWLQLYEEGGCGFTLSNAFYGLPFPGINAGDSLACAQIPTGLSANFGGGESWARSFFCIFIGVGKNWTGGIFCRDTSRLGDFTYIIANKA